MRSYRSVCTGSAGFSPGQGMRRIHNDSTMGSSGRASGCGRDSQDLGRILADGLYVRRTIVRSNGTCIPPRREVYRVNPGIMARNSIFLSKIISTILIAVSITSRDGRKSVHRYVPCCRMQQSLPRQGPSSHSVFHICVRIREQGKDASPRANP